MSADALQSRAGPPAADRPPEPARPYSRTSSCARPHPIVAAAIATLTETGRYRIVQRFDPGPRSYDHDIAPCKRGVFVDIETTGLDTHRDRIIQLAILPFTYTRDGRVLDAHECWVQLEDPGVDIPASVSRLTGLDHANVQGRRIAPEAVDATVESAQLVIAHNASFDRPMLERRFEVFRTKPWACSQRDVDWMLQGYASTRLEWLAYAHAGVYYDAHRADADCYVGVHLLSTELRSGRTALAALLTSARQRTTRISAVGAPFESRSALRTRGYTWYGGSSTRPKSWRREVPPQRVQAELDWLRNAAYRRTSMARVQCESLDAYSRYSDRAIEPVT